MNTISEIKILPAFSRLPQDIAEKISRDILDTESSCSVRDFNYMFEFFKESVQNSKTFELGDVSICFRAAIWIINYLSTEDPSQLHYHAAREVLKKYENGKLENDEGARDLLARALVKECNSFASLILPKEILQGNVPDSKKSMSFRGLLNPNADHLIYSIDGMLWLDDAFAQYITSIGDEGENAASEFSNASRSWYKEYECTRKALDLFRLWIDLSKEPYYCRYFYILAKVLWKDRIQLQFERKQKLYPALPIGLMETIKPALQKSSNIVQNRDRIDIYGKAGKVVASAQIPCIDAKAIPLVTRGIRSLGSLAGHRLLRWQVKSGCQNIIEGNPNPNTLLIEGGFETISHLIGCGKNKSTVTEVKSILYAQAHSSFYTSNGDRISSLIILNEIGYHRNKEPNRLSIVLGDVLLPHYLFSLPQNQRRLIPIISDLPPLVGSPNTHAAQAMLQLLVLEEFSKQSDRFAERGSVLISLEKWGEMSSEAALPKSNLSKVIDGWTTDDVNGRAFLKKDGEEFALSDIYIDVEKFLEDQGKQRMIGRKKGIISSDKTATKKSKLLES
jgi:hypothetical protein